MDIRQELTSQLSARQVRHLDDHIRTRLSKVLGRDDWKPEDLAGRLVIQHTPDKMEWFCLDDAPFMKVAPAEIEFEGGHIRSSRQFWVIRHPLETA